MERLHYDRLKDHLAPSMAYAEKVIREMRRELGEDTPVWRIAADHMRVGRDEAERIMAEGLPEGYNAISIAGHGAFIYLMMKEATEKASASEAASYDFVLRGMIYYLVDLYNTTGVVEMPPTETLTFMLAFHRLSFEKAGKRVFQVSDGLADMLMHTELRGLLTDDVRLPYESVYVCIPASLGLRVYNEVTGWHVVEGVYVSEDSKVPSEKPIVPVPPGNQSSRGWRLMIVGKSKDPTNELDDAILYYTIHLPEGRALEDELRDVQKSARQRKHELSEIMAEDEARLFRFVLNAMIYAAWPDAEVDHVMMNKEARQLWDRMQKLPGKSKKKDKLKERFKQMDPQKVIILGRSIIVDRSQPSGGGGDGTGPKLSVRVRVKGHWRRYHVGEGRAEIRRNWIQPFWRGPEDGIRIEPTTHILKKG